MTTLLGRLARGVSLAAGIAAAVLSVTASAAQSTTADNARAMAGEWTGDLDGMVERGRVRVLVVQSKTFFFLDGARQRGITHDVFKQFEKSLNEKLGRKTDLVDVVFVPVARNELLPALVSGRGDVAAANLTITEERRAAVDFSAPLLKGVKEIVVTGPASEPLATLDDLSGRTIYVRRSSSYHDSLERLNVSFTAAGKAPIELAPADENLEDEDLLEMVNAGLIPMVVVDDHKAKFWAQVLEGIELHSEVAVREGGSIAWAIRKDSPKLKAALDEFAATTKKGTLLGNILLKRYLKSTKFVKNALSDEEMAKFQRTIELFQQNAGEYGFDWLIVAALGYQESRLDQSVRSHAGAVGVMQLLPSTAADPNVGIPDIEKLESNIAAGVKYLDFLRSRYFDDQPMDRLNKWLFTFASYNAGPAKVARLRKEAAEEGLDPNVWFRHVETIAAKRIGRETVQYVSSIYKYYIAYGLVIERERRREAAKVAND